MPEHGAYASNVPYGIVTFVTDWLIFNYVLVQIGYLHHVSKLLTSREAP